jgi:hypothetical protein
MSIDNEELNDDTLFNDVVSDEPAETPEVPATEPEPAKPEAEAETEVTAEETETPEDKEPKGRIPQWRREEIAAEKNRAVDEARAAREQLATERSQREELQRRLAALEKPPVEKEAPDPLLDPKGYAAAIREELRQEMIVERHENSLQTAKRIYKAEFDEAYAAAKQKLDPTSWAQMQKSRDIGETLMEWHREQKTRAEVGNDLNAYKQRLRDEALKDPEFRKAAMEAWREQAQPSSNGRPRVELPPSLNGASRSNASIRSSNQDVSDSELFDITTG